MNQPSSITRPECWLLGESWNGDMGNKRSGSTRLCSVWTYSGDGGCSCIDQKQESHRRLHFSCFVVNSSSQGWIQGIHSGVVASLPSGVYVIYWQLQFPVALGARVPCRIWAMAGAPGCCNMPGSSRWGISAMAVLIWPCSAAARSCGEQLYRISSSVALAPSPSTLL